MPATTLHHYARRIERFWSRHQDRPVVLSPKEWRLVCSWYERGIPLRLVEEALEEDAQRRRTGRTPRRLSYFAAAIEESWDALVEGRVAPHESAEPGPRPEGDPVAEAARAWRERQAAEGDASPLGALLGALLAELEQGTPPDVLDDRLDRELPLLAPAAEREAAEAEVGRRLAPYRETMAPERLERTRGRATLELLRRRLGLRRLAGESARFGPDGDRGLVAPPSAD